MVALEGASGVGKTTLSKALGRAIGAVTVAEAFDRLGRSPSLAYSNPLELVRIEHALLREESLRFREAKALQRGGRAVVLDTGFLGPLTYTVGLAQRTPALRPALERVVEEVRSLIRAGTLGLPDLTIYLTLGERTVARRLNSAERTHPSRWRTRHRQVEPCERWLWTVTYPSVARGRLVLVDARGSVAEVARRIGEQVRASPDLGPPARVALRVVDRFLRHGLQRRGNG